MVLTNEEEKVLEWLDEERDKGNYTIAWDEFTSKVEEIIGEEFDEISEERFSFNLIGVTVSIEEDKKMYPVRDLEQGITRGYSTD